jgi:soluble lytic murein transglycosylase
LQKINIRQKHFRGMLGFIAGLSCVGTALAATVPLPVQKPTTPVQSRIHDPIDDILQKPASKTGKAATQNVRLPHRKPGMPAPSLSSVPAAGASEAAVPAQKTSLLDRVFGHLSGARRLSEDDAARYAHIFAFQNVGNFKRADVEIGKLKDDRLMGHVLFQRYMHPDYHSHYAELAEWMRRFGDHPEAERIYALAESRKPAEAVLSRPRTGHGVTGQQDYDVGQLAQPYLSQRRHGGRALDIIRLVRRHLSDAPSTALRHLDTAEGHSLFKPAEYDALLADIAASYFFNGRLDKAYETATAAVSRSGMDVPQAGWIAGLSSWRLGKYEEAARNFEITANSARSSAWMSAAGAHWAARSYLRSHKPEKVSYWLRRSAEYPRTFYGIISLKALGMEQMKFNWKAPALTEKHVKALSAIPAGRRALALVDAERSDLAELELRQINPGRDTLLQQAMIALAIDKGMPNLAMRMGSAFRDEKGDLYDAALYPDAPWKPERGFQVDKALVYAFIRQESKFDPQAKNRSSGAQGLMQIMPLTAKHVARNHGETIDISKLRDPHVNIDLGQKYLAELLDHDVVDNNLFKLAVAYNAGPGKLSRWQQSVSYEDDPLLFIESIPVSETRIFVERVMANYWIYRLKFSQVTASLDRVVEGSWPTYAAQDTPDRRIFAEAASFFGR